MKPYLPLVALAALGVSLAASAQPLPKGTALKPPADAGAQPDVPVDLMKAVTKRLSADDFEGRAPST
ncbi:hypothetical protein LH128_25298, partial [Sphingomonas sp. LH128]